MAAVRRLSTRSGSRRPPVTTTSSSCWTRPARPWLPSCWTAPACSRRRLRLDQAPAGVVALGVAGVGVAVEEVEWQTFVGHLQRPVGACDGSELAGDAGTPGWRRSAGDADGRPGRGAPAGALAHAGRVTVEGV